jgi:hypothetical protein
LRDTRHSFCYLRRVRLYVELEDQPGARGVINRLLTALVMLIMLPVIAFLAFLDWLECRY